MIDTLKSIDVNIAKALVMINAYAMASLNEDQKKRYLESLKISGLFPDNNQTIVKETEV